LVGEFHGVYQTHAELADSSNPTGFSVSVKRGVVMTDVFDQEGLPEHAMQIHRRNAYNCIIPFILENNAICNAVDDQHSTTWILFVALVGEPRCDLLRKIAYPFAVEVYVRYRDWLSPSRSRRILFGPKEPPS